MAAVVDVTMTEAVSAVFMPVTTWNPILVGDMTALIAGTGGAVVS